MTLQSIQQFPITVWPPGQISAVPVERWAVRTGDGGNLDWYPAIEPRELPDEWVLRQLADVDLEDDHAVATLLGDFGVISRPYFDPTGVPDDRRSKLAPPSDDQRDGWWEQRDDGTLEDARWWLKTARALAGVWREASSGGDPITAWSAEGFSSFDEQHAQAPAWVVWAQFALALDAGLRPFRARVEYRVEIPDVDVTYGLPPVGLYSAACLQVYNLVVGKFVARRCANATCGQVFVHQRGGARHGQYRSKGVKYCTPECARAEAQRQYRRRKAAARADA